MLKTSILTLSLALAGTTAFAQTAAPDPDAAAAAAKNQLGILEYCQTEGHIEGTAVEIQAKMLEMVPAAQNQETVDAAYAKGKEGVLSVGGTESDLKLLDSQGGSLADVCKQMADAMAAVAGQIPG